MQIGQVVVDLETVVSDKIGIAAALAYDGASFGLGAFTIDFPIWGNEEDHFEVVDDIEYAGVMVG